VNPYDSNLQYWSLELWASGSLVGSLTTTQTHSLNLNRHTNGKARANFTSTDDKLEAGQTREGVLSSEKSELPKGQKSGPFIGKLSCDNHMTSHVTFLFLVTFIHDSEVNSFIQNMIGQLWRSIFLVNFDWSV